MDAAGEPVWPSKRVKELGLQETGLMAKPVVEKAGYATKCRAKFLNRPFLYKHLFIRFKQLLAVCHCQEAQTNVVIFIYIHNTLQWDISCPKKLTAFHGEMINTFKAQLPGLLVTTLCCKCLHVEGHVTKYYVVFSGVGLDWSCSKILVQPNTHLELLDYFCHAQHARVLQNRPRCAECQI